MRMLWLLAAVAQVSVIPGAVPRLVDTRSGQVVTAKDYLIRAVPLTSVTIPHIMQQNELTGRIDNFLKAAKK